MKNKKEKYIRNAIERLIQYLPELDQNIVFKDNVLTINDSTPLIGKILNLFYGVIIFLIPISFFWIPTYLVVRIILILISYLVLRNQIISSIYYKNHITINFENEFAIFKSNLFENKISFKDFSHIKAKHYSIQYTSGSDIYFLVTKSRKSIYLGEYTEREGGSQFKNLLRLCFEGK